MIDLDQGNFPSGTTYSVDIEDSSKYEVDNSGTVRIKSEVVLNDSVSKNILGNDLINYLAGLGDSNTDLDHEKFEDEANISIEIPNEPTQKIALKIVPKKLNLKKTLL